VFLLEPRDNILERRVGFENEAIPQRPLRRPVLIFLGHNRFRETEEWQGEVHEPIFVVLEFFLAIDDLMGEPVGQWMSNLQHNDRKVAYLV
jgi:hypothetical protein